MSEPTAARVSLQRLQPNLPPAHCVSAAAARELPARHFGGKIVGSAISAITSTNGAALLNPIDHYFIVMYH
ncbi:MAG: hypothetical protein R3E39_23465 [Anaerolineae bacterium]